MSAGLGVRRSVEVSGGTVEYRERGAGPPVVFVHGVLVNADLWRAVVPTVAAAGNRCLAPDWPLGSHSRAVPGADLSPPGVADMIAEFLAKLDLRDVTLVANDTGGALVQLLITRKPARVARVVLTPADSFERFFPPELNYLAKLARLPGSAWLMAQALRPRVLQRLPIAFGGLTKRRIPDDIMDSYLLPSRRDPAIRRDLRAFLRTVHKRHTLAAAAELHRFDRPVLLAWAQEDRLFPISLAHRLAEILPNATVTPIADSLTFVPEDQPQVLAGLINEFTRV